jgi:hypothetical protein
MSAHRKEGDTFKILTALGTPVNGFCRIFGELGEKVLREQKGRPTDRPKKG